MGTPLPFVAGTVSSGSVSIAAIAAIAAIEHSESLNPIPTCGPR
jgi:hypothetical protein